MTGGIHFFPLVREQWRRLRKRIIRNSVLDPATGCWLWTGSVKYNRCGTAYGRISFRVGGELRARAWSAHVVSYMAFNGGQKTIGLVRAHTCHNPLCVNPDHLVEISQSGNLKMSAADGRLERRAA